MSFIARLHAYEDFGPFERPILAEAWYEINNPDVEQSDVAVERLFRQIAVDFAREYGDQIDPSILDDFNWGDFIGEIPDDFLDRYGVHVAYSVDVNNTSVLVFTHHDELILEDM